MWVIDIRHWLDDTQTSPAVSQLKSKVKKISEIIAYATSVEAGISVDSQVLDNLLAKVAEENNGMVFMTESGDNISKPEDACHSQFPWLCAEIVDGEFPETVLKVMNRVMLMFRS